MVDMSAQVDAEVAARAALRESAVGLQKYLAELVGQLDNKLGGAGTPFGGVASNGFAPAARTGATPTAAAVAGATPTANGTTPTAATFAAPVAAAAAPAPAAPASKVSSLTDELDDMFK